MPSENVEIVRRLFDAFNRGDVKGCLEIMDPDIQYDLTEAIGPYSGTYKGRAAIGELMEAYFDAWDELRWEPDRIIEAPDGRVVVLHAARGRGEGSGIAVDAQTNQVYTLDDGLILKAKMYQDASEALSSVGLQNSNE